MSGTKESWVFVFNFRVKFIRIQAVKNVVLLLAESMKVTFACYNA